MSIINMTSDTAAVGDVVQLAIYLVMGVVAFFLVLKLIKEIVELIDEKRKMKYKNSSKSNYVELQTAAKAAEPDSAPSTYRKVQGFPVILNMDMQNYFIPGRDIYENARAGGNMRSVVFGDADSLQKLLDEKAGTGEFVAANKERVKFGKTLGQYVDPVARTKTATTIGIIHYMPQGAYIIPARPSAEEDFNG